MGGPQEHGQLPVGEKVLAVPAMGAPLPEQLSIIPGQQVEVVNQRDLFCLRIALAAGTRRNLRPPLLTEGSAAPGAWPVLRVFTTTAGA
ncbi:MAG: hypothetical protein P8Y63_03355 [Deltaproteobacteria bacterium]